MLFPPRPRLPPFPATLSSFVGLLLVATSAPSKPTELAACRLPHARGALSHHLPVCRQDPVDLADDRRRSAETAATLPSPPGARDVGFHSLDDLVQTGPACHLGSIFAQSFLLPRRLLRSGLHHGLWLGTWLFSVFPVTGPKSTYICHICTRMSPRKYGTGKLSGSLTRAASCGRVEEDPSWLPNFKLKEVLGRDQACGPPCFCPCSNSYRRASARQNQHHSHVRLVRVEGLQLCDAHWNGDRQLCPTARHATCTGILGPSQGWPA